jgi:transcription elongation GreA/GreB family factor/very-short-patch-repair endonuclease
LEFARDGVIRNEAETDVPPESDFEIAVIDVLRGKGYEVTPQLGVAGFRIDIAVKHPRARSSYLAAIECDGATYHSGVSVRDRDRIRQEILESLGWRGRIWRIWSTDWFRNPRGEAEKLFAFLEHLAKAPLPNEGAALNKGREKSKGTAPAASEVVAALANAKTSKTDGGLLLDEDETDLTIEVGDIVSCRRSADPRKAIRFTVTENKTDLAKGLVSRDHEIGAALLGATVGEEVVVRRSGQASETFVVEEICRPE